MVRGRLRPVKQSRVIGDSDPDVLRLPPAEPDCKVHFGLRLADQPCFAASR